MEILKKENVFSGHYRLNKVYLKTKLGETIEREQFETSNSIGVLVHDPKLRKIILVRQFRIGPEKPLLEIVAGKIEKKDDDVEETVRREVLEEVGYEVDKLEKLHSFYPAPGPVSELMTLYYAIVSKRVSAGGGLESESEEIEVVEMSEEEFLQFDFQDAKSLIAQKWYARQAES